MIGLILPIRQRKKTNLKGSDFTGSRDKHFKGQQSTEELICFFRRHWVTVLSDVGLWTLLTFAEIVFISNFGRFAGVVRGNVPIGILYFGVLVLMTVYLHKIFLRFFAYFLNIVVFTDSRVIVHNKTLFMKDSHEVLDVTKIQDVKKTQDGIFGNFLQYGELVITLASDKAVRPIPYVPNVNFHFRCLSRIKRDADLRGQIEHLREEEFRDHRSFSKEKSEEMIRLERQQVEDAYKKIMGEIVKSKTEVVRVNIRPPVYHAPSYTDLVLPQGDLDM